jgi:uroporphyrinogen decarboxylase
MSNNAKERVLRAIALEASDRVPMDFQANKWVLERLHKDLGTTSHKELLTRLGSDIVDLRGVVDPTYCGPVPFVRDIGDGVYENFWGWRQKVMNTATGPEDSFVEFVLAEAQSVEDLERHTWPNPDWFDFSDFAARLEPWSEFAVMASGPSVFQHPTFLRKIDNLLMDMALRPEMAHHIMDRFTDFYLAFFDRMFTVAPGRIDILRIADDLGTQTGLFFSPEMIDTFVLTRVRKLVDLAHSHDVKVMFHSCGAILPIIDKIIEAGVDILDPLQAAADGMDPNVLKKEFGNRICLHGGICTQHVLPNGTEAEVRETVSSLIQILGKGGGYILSPCHVLQTDVPTRNILAASEVRS